MFMKILRNFTLVFLSASLCFTTVACGGGAEQNRPNTRQVSNQTSNVARNVRLSDGQYPVQQASYSDENGEYTLFLLNSNPPTFKTQKLQMARLTDEEIQQGKTSYLKVDNGQPILYATKDLKIEYVHAVTETKTDPQTGQQQVVVVRRENSFWTPFAGALAGQVVGNLLFRPQYYVPPVYQPGSVLTGYGGYGRTYDRAVTRYRDRYNSAPISVRNRTRFRTTGNIRRSNPRGSAVRTSPNRTTTTRTNTNRTRATGSGYGGSKLRTTGKSGASRRRNSGRSSFGSGGRSRSRSFGGRRGRR
ncbi:MAG: hypothetical protein AAF378_00835 [Cyanobacteria bacterium P01_A01_bin.84]